MVIVDPAELRVERSGTVDMVREARVVLPDDLAAVAFDSVRLVVFDDCDLGDTPVGENPAGARGAI